MDMGAGTSRRRGREQWAKIIAAFERAGKTHEEFCARRGLNVGTFRHWLYAQRRSSGVRTEVALLPVEISEPVALIEDERSPRGAVEIDLGRLQVRVPVGADVRYVAALVAELGRC